VVLAGDCVGDCVGVAVVCHCEALDGVGEFGVVYGGCCEYCLDGCWVFGVGVGEFGLVEG